MRIVGRLEIEEQRRISLRIPFLNVTGNLLISNFTLRLIMIQRTYVRTWHMFHE
jgi:hypothetical protein